MAVLLATRDVVFTAASVTGQVDARAHTTLYQGQPFELYVLWQVDTGGNYEIKVKTGSQTLFDSIMSNYTPNQILESDMGSVTFPNAASFTITVQLYTYP
jgi:hypothetical protein